MAKKKIKKPILVYYEFECGCKIKATHFKKWPRKKTCPEHKKPLVSKCLKCIECGIHLIVEPSSNIKYCDECRRLVTIREHLEYQRKNRAKVNARRRKRAAEERALRPPKPKKPKTIKKLTLKPKKKPFDQTRRGECKFGDYCMDRQFRTGERFNCFGCIRFTPLELDPMDYVKTVSMWDTAEMFNGQTRKTRINKPARQIA